MLTQHSSRFSDRLDKYARQYYLKSPESMDTNPTELSTLFSALEEDAEKTKGKITRIKIGHTVTLFDVKAKEIITLTLVSPRNSNPEKGRISCFSLLGRQLIGRTLGDVIEVKIFYRAEMFRVVRIEN